MKNRNPFSRHGRLLLVGVLSLLTTMLGACSQDKSWSLVNITGVMPSLAFRLVDDAGQTVTAETYRGKIALLYFGYTNCPDVCPTTLARLSQALSELKDGAAKVRVLLVTVDPKRDTPQLLKSYTQAFGAEFVGLRADDPELRKLTKRYRVTYSLGKPDSHGNYEVTHSSAVFIFDATGKARLIAESGDSAGAITHDLRQLIGGA
jgi:protein SCO1/2